MSFISLRQVGVSMSGPLFQNLTLSIGDGCRIGIIAGNGGGKTTLLRCLAGLIEPTEGEVIHSRGLRLGYIEQDVPTALMNQTLYECLHSSLAFDQQTDAWRVDVLLDSFDVPKELHQRPIHALSGGWQKLALIARAFAAEPDALLLDEPTNHLDLSKIQFLERWLADNTCHMPMAIVSHDRRFLDACTTHTLFLRPKDSKLYAQTYSKAKYLVEQEDAADQTRLEQDIKEAQRLRRSANALKNIGINSRCDNAQKKAKQVFARVTEIESSLKEPHKERTGRIQLNSRNIHAKILLSLDHLVVRAPDGTALFKTGQIKILQGDRIALHGKNGTGKSRLIQLIHQAFVHQSNQAEIKLSPSVIMGYADQQMTQLQDSETPFNLIATRFRLGDQQSRTLLAGAGFPVDRQNSLIKTFSLGQKARLGMLALRLTEPNFYLLDEPTNHVDIMGQEKLESEILAQKATCLLVSHDRHFVDAIATRHLAIEGGKLLELD